MHVSEPHRRRTQPRAFLFLPSERVPVDLPRNFHGAARRGNEITDEIIGQILGERSYDSIPFSRTRSFGAFHKRGFMFPVNQVHLSRVTRLTKPGGKEESVIESR